jgi:hypothetical protein
MKEVAKKIEIAANVAIIVLAIAILAALAKKYIFEKKVVVDSSEIAIGNVISIPNVDFSKKNQTIVLALKKGCKFCNESASFYQRLFNEIEVQGKTQLVVVMPDQQQEGIDYLSGLGLHSDLIVQIPLNQIHIKGTPTILLINNSGVVTSQWLGRLSPSKESEVFAKI